LPGPIIPCDGGFYVRKRDGEKLDLRIREDGRYVTPVTPVHLSHLSHLCTRAPVHPGGHSVILQNVRMKSE